MRLRRTRLTSGVSLQEQVRCLEDRSSQQHHKVRLHVSVARTCLVCVLGSLAQVLIVGGGTGGVTTAAQLARHANGPGASSIAVVEPKELHWYQPMWTMIGGGLGFKKENSSRPLSSVVPKV